MFGTCGGGGVKEVYKRYGTVYNNNMFNLYYYIMLYYIKKKTVSREEYGDKKQIWSVCEKFSFFRQSGGGGYNFRPKILAHDR